MSMGFLRFYTLAQGIKKRKEVGVRRWRCGETDRIHGLLAPSGTGDEITEGQLSTP